MKNIFFKYQFHIIAAFFTIFIFIMLYFMANGEVEKNRQIELWKENVQACCCR